MNLFAGIVLVQDETAMRQIKKQRRTGMANKRCSLSYNLSI
jgi:hypothetical protein